MWLAVRGRDVLATMAVAEPVAALILGVGVGLMTAHLAVVFKSRLRRVFGVIADSSVAHADSLSG
jgi:hypothetical protein